MKKKQHHNLARHGIILAVLGVGMLGVAYAFVPLYRMFCQALGVPLLTDAAKNKPTKPAEPVQMTDRQIIVRFSGVVNDGMPIKFAPVTRHIDTLVGKPTLTAYHASNPTNHAIEGVAIHTMTGTGNYGGVDVTQYIELIQCFCFNHQVYPAHGEVNLPLSFTIKPDLPKGIHTITFNYTLFPADE